MTSSFGKDVAKLLSGTQYVGFKKMKRALNSLSADDEQQVNTRPETKVSGTQYVGFKKILVGHKRALRTLYQLTMNSK